MAYTGTGTVEDPYIVDNYTDFLAVLLLPYTADARNISFDPNNANKVIDLSTDSRYNLGMDFLIPTVTTSSNKHNITINGNGWTIKNGRFKSVSDFYGSNTHSLTISYLKIVNLLMSPGECANNGYRLFGLSQSTGGNIKYDHVSWSFILHTYQKDYSTLIDTNTESIDCSYYLHFCDNATSPSAYMGPLFKFGGNSTRNNIEFHNLKFDMQYYSSEGIISGTDYTSVYGDIYFNYSRSTYSIFASSCSNCIAALTVTGSVSSVNVTSNSTTSYIINDLPKPSNVNITAPHQLTSAEAKSEANLINIGFLP